MNESKGYIFKYHKNNEAMHKIIKNKNILKMNNVLVNINVAPIHDEINVGKQIEESK